MPTSVRYNPVQPPQQPAPPTHFSYQPAQPQQQPQPQQPQQQSSIATQHRHHHHHHHHHNAHHSSPTLQTHSLSSYSNHRLNSNNNNIHGQQTSISTPSLSSNQSSAYFLDRVDLENYTTHTLKQTVEAILSKTKSKGLKVKLSLPDDGLIIDNITDPTQSWIFKTPELLYFWRDPYYMNIIVVVTINRSRHHLNQPYSASIFRLRGTDSAQAFLQLAQRFFVNLSGSVSASSVAKPSRYKSVDKLPRDEEHSVDHNTLTNHKTKTKSVSIVNEQSAFAPKATQSRHQSSPPPASSATIRRVTRAEFDPGKSSTTDSATGTANNRTYSETASSVDSQTTNSAKEILSYTKKISRGVGGRDDDEDDDDDKMTTISNNLSGGQIAELMRELKELRNEIASLKLDKRISHDGRSMSISPLTAKLDKSKSVLDTNTTTTTSSSSFPDITSQSEVDAETQTDFSLINHRRRQLMKKNKKTMIGSGGVSTLSKKTAQQATVRNGRRTFSNSSTNTVSDQEEAAPDLSSPVNDVSNDNQPVSSNQQAFQPVILSAPPRPVLGRSQSSFLPLNNLSAYSMTNGNQIVPSSNAAEEGLPPHGLPVTLEKEIDQFLSTNIPSSNTDLLGPQTPMVKAGAASFRASNENTKPPTDHIYENIPILIPPKVKRESFYNIPIITVDDQQQQQQPLPAAQQLNQPGNYLYYTLANNSEGDGQQQYLIPGQLMASSPPTNDSTGADPQALPLNFQPQKPQIISVGRHRNQPIYFANHLTNPIFNVDRQLLTNTIANQFGVDLNSPQLQQLISNQHLFATRKRTFANMVWQLTPDEETALCSSPTATTVDVIDVDITESTTFTSRSILKATKRFRPTAKRRSISWDTTLE